MPKWAHGQGLRSLSEKNDVGELGVDAVNGTKKGAVALKLRFLQEKTMFVFERGERE